MAWATTVLLTIQGRSDPGSSRQMPCSDDGIECILSHPALRHHPLILTLTKDSAGDLPSRVCQVLPNVPLHAPSSASFTALLRQ